MSTHMLADSLLIASNIADVLSLYVPSKLNASIDSIVAIKSWTLILTSIHELQGP